MDARGTQRRRPVPRRSAKPPRPSSGQVLLFNKPYGVVCQFTPHTSRPTLAAFIDRPGFYPAGRLDWDSEGLLLLTDDGALQHAIAHPSRKLPKTYLAQVEGLTTDAALEQLRDGVELNDGKTRPALIERCDPPTDLWQREPPIRYRVAIPTSWLSLTITEGRNRQVRRMTAAVGFPTLRLIRVRIGPWALEGLAPGTMSIQPAVALDTPRTKRAAIDAPSPGGYSSAVEEVDLLKGE